MSSINLSDILNHASQNKALEELIPELHQLKNVIETQGWHAHQSVYDHSIKTVESLDTLLASQLSTPIRDYTNNYLAQPIEAHTRGDLLRLAVLLHDIGKIISLQHNATGETSSPSHGLIGSWVAKPIVKHLDLTEVEQTYVLGVIADHLVPSDLIEMAINNETPAQAITNLLLEHRQNTALELLLTAYADWLGCDVMPEMEVVRDKRITIATECLEAMAQGK